MTYNVLGGMLDLTQLSTFLTDRPT